MSGSIMETSVKYPLHASKYTLKGVIEKGVKSNIYNAKVNHSGEKVTIILVEIDCSVCISCFEKTRIEHPDISFLISFIDGQFLWIVIPLKDENVNHLSKDPISSLFREILIFTDRIHKDLIHPE